ncbi:MAG TPA: DUF4367 domain-containing protein, partial [Candidatus Evtepia faecigallinarum]|nr:DUF4367 domain-containing protein [Candidatus Evtepia faecigallinarum]
MITEDALRRAAREADRALADSLPDPADCAHTFSPQFQRRMARLIRRHRYKGLYRGLRRAACVLLAVLLGGTVFLSTNAQAREAFFGWVREQVEGAQRYFHQGNVTSASEIVHYQIDIPEGYWLEDSLEAEGYFDYYYVNDDGDSIEFTYQYETEAAGGELYVDDRETEKKQVMVCGTPGELYLSNEEEMSNTVIWMDQSTGALIDVTAFLDEDAL